ncbi:MAG: extracellular solute-binding protein, partial [Nitriliruptorales bacterium]
MALQRDQPVPIYYQLKTLLLEEILRGVYGRDGRLPTEHELCERYGISRTPVSRALSELAAEGVVVRRRRHGTFVNPHWLQRRDGPELRILVPDGPWDTVLAGTADGALRRSVARVPLGDLHRTLVRAVAEGSAPDMAVVDSVWVAELAADGFLWALEDLDDVWVQEELVGDVVPSLLEASRHEGRTYAAPAEVDVAGLWYRRDEVERSGSGAPATWEELHAAAAALRAGGATQPIVLPAGTRAGETATYALVALLASNGVSVLSDTAVTLDSPATVEALEFLRRLAEEDLLPPDVVGYDWDRPARLLAEGKAAFHLGGSYEARTLAEVSGLPLAKIMDHFGFVPVPAGPRGEPASLAGGMAYAVFRQAQEPRVAAELIRRTLAPDALAAMAIDTGQIPPRRSAARLVAPERSFLAATTAMLDHAVSRPVTRFYPRVSAQLQAMIEAVLIGRHMPREAAAHTSE